MEARDKENKRKKLLLVFNDEAGNGKFISKKRTIIKYLRKIKYPFSVMDADKLTAEKDLSGFESVVAVGGDGTILKILPFIANTSIKLGIIPCGTANLFAASLCIPSNIEKATDIVLNGNSMKVDIGKAGNDYFALRIGVGFDADVVNNTRRHWKRRLGYFAYLIQGFINCFKLSNKSYKVTIDNKTFEVNANSIIVANAGNMFRNLFSISPSGSVTDGKLDVFILLAKNFPEFLGVLFRLFTGRINRSANVIHGKARNIKIEKLSQFAHIDGEPYKTDNIEISVLPQALNVLVPN